MQLSAPFSISSRLLPALVVGGATIQVEYAGSKLGRTVYRWTIDLPDGSTHTGDDLSSGVGGGTIQEGFSSLVSFLSACGESVNYRDRTGRTGESADLFPGPVAEWAGAHSDDLGMLCCELDENPDLIQE